MRWAAILFGTTLVFSAAGNVRAQQTIPIRPLPPGTQLPTPARIRVGRNVQAAKLTSHVIPVYPPVAIQANISGTVVLHVVIGSDGSVKDADAISGPQVLLQSAIDAVKQWRYQPTLLNGRPVEVDTSVQVVYGLVADPGKGPTTVVAIGESATQTVAANLAGAAKPIDPQLKADILQMLDSMHFRDNEKTVFQNVYRSIRPTILRTLPDTPNREKIADAYGEKLGDLVGSGDYTDALVAIYAKYLSDDDVKGLTAFYGTSAGQHMLAVAPQIAGDATQLGMRIAMEHVAGIFKELCTEYPELQGKASFCPASATETKGQLSRPIGNGLGD